MSSLSTLFFTSPKRRQVENVTSFGMESYIPTAPMHVDDSAAGWNAMRTRLIALEERVKVLESRRWWRLGR